MGLLGLTRDLLLNWLAALIIAVGWTITKVRMGFEWGRVAYRIGVETARGVKLDEVS